MTSGPITLNEALDISEFCAEAGSTPTSLPVIRLPIGGATLEPQTDPTSGPPTSCGLVLPLTAQISSALGSIQPVLTILDTVAQLIQCFQLSTEALSNPTKIPDLVKCIPGLVSKVNQLLGLIPQFPQGIATMITFIVDVLRFVAQVIDCVVGQLQSIVVAIDDLSAQIDALDQLQDPEDIGRAQTLIDCGMEAANESASSAISALGPVARLLCTSRALLSIIPSPGPGLPSGKDLACLLTIPDPSETSVLADVVDVLATVSEILNTTVELIEQVGAVVGAPFPAPEVGFVCPFDDVCDEEEEEEEVLLPPTIAEVQDTAGSPLASIPVQTDSSGVFSVRIIGTNYIDEQQTKLFFNTAQVPDIVIRNAETIEADIPNGVLLNAGTSVLTISSEPAGGVPPFGGLTGPDGEETESGVVVSEAFEIDVV